MSASSKLHANTYFLPHFPFAKYQKTNKKQKNVNKMHFFAKKFVQFKNLL